MAIFETILNVECDFSCLFWCFLFVVLLSIEDEAFLEKGSMLSSSFMVVFDIIIIRIFDDSCVCSLFFSCFAFFHVWV